MTNETTDSASQASRPPLASSDTPGGNLLVTYEAQDRKARGAGPRSQMSCVFPSSSRVYRGDL